MEVVHIRVLLPLFLKNNKGDYVMIVFNDDLLYLIIRKAENLPTVQYNSYNILKLKGFYLWIGIKTPFFYNLEKGEKGYGQHIFIKKGTKRI